MSGLFDVKVPFGSAPGTSTVVVPVNVPVRNVYGKVVTDELVPESRFGFR